MSTELQITQDTQYSIIENVKLDFVSSTLQKIKDFQSVVNSQLIENHDYGKIPGCGNKPTLLKPGAEKINMILGIYPEYKLITNIEEFEKGHFAYTIECTLFDKSGRPVSSGVGHCNNYEKKYKTQDACSIANTILKMSKKRAFIDATLQVASLSEVFTQDLEDLKANGVIQDKTENKPQAEKSEYSCGKCGKQLTLNEAKYSTELCYKCQKG